MYFCVYYTGSQDKETAYLKQTLLTLISSLTLRSYTGLYHQMNNNANWWEIDRVKLSYCSCFICKTSCVLELVETDEMNIKLCNPVVEKRIALLTERFDETCYTNTGYVIVALSRKVMSIWYVLCNIKPSMDNGPIPIDLTSFFSKFIL
jgi:hypothetical protein